LLRAVIVRQDAGGRVTGPFLAGALDFYWLTNETVMKSDALLSPTVPDRIAMFILSPALINPPVYSLQIGSMGRNQPLKRFLKANPATQETVARSAIEDGSGVGAIGRGNNSPRHCYHENSPA
jgi:hypothetical protein